MSERPNARVLVFEPMGHNLIIDLHHRSTDSERRASTVAPVGTRTPGSTGSPRLSYCVAELPSYYLRKPGFRAAFDAATDTLSNDLFKEEHDSQAGEYLRALRRRWLFILALVVLAGWTAVAFVATADKKYEARRTFSSSVRRLDRRVRRYHPLPRPQRQHLPRRSHAATPATTDAVIERLNLGVSREDLLGRVQIRPLEQSGIVSIIAEAGSPEAAARLANTFAEVFIERRTTEFRPVEARIDQVEAQLNQLGSESTDEQLRLRCRKNSPR